MACERWRELVSAQLDGEDDPADRPRVDEHLAGCAGCRQWLDQAATVNRLTRTGLVGVVPDLSVAILAALPGGTASPDEDARPGEPARRRWLRSGPLYVGLAAVGAVQLILGLAQVGGGAGGGHVHTGLDATPGHLWHESAAWNVAVGAGFLFIALRRTRPTALVPMLTAFVAMLLLLSVNDLSAGRVDTTRLVSHGFLILGWLIVVALSRVARDFALPPGERMAGGNGWHFVEDEDVPEPILPQLRLVPRGPLSAAATMPLSAVATMPSKRATAPGRQAMRPGEQARVLGRSATALGKQAIAPGGRAAAPGREAAALGKQTTMPGSQAAVPGKVPLDWDAAVARRRAALPEQQAGRAA